MQARPTAPEAPTGDDAATLTISPEKACFIILKAREFDAKLFCPFGCQKARGCGSSPNGRRCFGSLRLRLGNKARAVRCFNTCITVEGVPTSGSVKSRWMCSGITT